MKPKHLYSISHRYKCKVTHSNQTNEKETKNMFDINYDNIWSYHNAPVKPIGNINDNILGLELEIKDSSCDEILEELVNDNVLGVPFNDGGEEGMQLTEDGSVRFEIVFNADIKSRLLNRLNLLNGYGLTPANCRNEYENDDSSSTSCHIHINRNYLSLKGIREVTIFRLLEMYSPIIYAISERNTYQWDRWTPSQVLNHKYETSFREIVEDVITIYPDDDDRYAMINTSNSNTIELRGFSNNNGGFDYSRIEMYLSFVEFIIKQAEEMKGKNFIKEYKKLYSELEVFFKQNYPHFYKKYDLNTIFNQNEDLIEFKRTIKSDRDYLYQTKRYLVLNNQDKDFDHYSQSIYSYIMGIKRSSKYFDSFNTLTLSHKGIEEYLEQIEYYKYLCFNSHLQEFLRNHILNR